MEMEGEGLEIEVKLRGETMETTIARLARLPARQQAGRAFESNDVFDTPEGALRAAGRLLRLRIVAGRGILTWKEEVASVIQAKVRCELQTSLGSPEAARAILTKLGLVRVYHYEKYRTHYVWDDEASGGRLAISVDETPIGLFVELEGPKESIDRAADRMGYAPGDYIVDDYRTLHRAWLAERGLPAGDMIFG